MDKKVGTYKFNSADDRQRELLAAELALAPKSRAANIATVIVLLAIVFGFAIGFILVPDKTFSEEENRNLQGVPEFTWEALVNGEYTSAVADYMADQFPTREFFIELKAAAELALGKMQNNDVIVGKNGYLVERMDEANGENLAVNIRAISAFAKAAEAAGIPVNVSIAGRLADVADSVLPFDYSKAEPNDIWLELAALADELDLDYTDLREPLSDKLAAGEYVYYKTDHHWTTLGAYYAYAEIMAELGKEAEGKDFFTEEIASREFYGTTWSTAGIRWAAPDVMTYFRYAGDEDFTVSLYGLGAGGAALERQGLYDRSYLETKDKYASFIYTNIGRIDIKKNTDGERETLLVIKDSFAMCMLPMLAEEYDLVVIDPRYYISAAYELIEAEGIDAVLVLYNMDSLTTGTDARILAARLPE